MKLLVHTVALGLTLATFGCAGAKVATEDKTDAAFPTSTGGDMPIGGSGGSPGGQDIVLHPPTDAVNTRPATGTCDVVANTGCPATQKCTAMQQMDGSFALGCGATGTKAEGESCNQEATDSYQTGDNCASGLACFIVQGDSAPVCHRMCLPDAKPAMCSASQACELPVKGLSDVRFCRAATVNPPGPDGGDAGGSTSTTCSPLDQKGCPDGQSCYFAAKGPICWKTGSKNSGDSCTSPTDCVRGSTCVSTGSAMNCATFCSTDAGAGPGCTGGATCIGFNQASAPAGLGYCRK